MQWLLGVEYCTYTNYDQIHVYVYISYHHIAICYTNLCCNLNLNGQLEGRKEMFYLTMHSTHFIYGYMASNIW